jgi:hypothetical protein
LLLRYCLVPSPFLLLQLSMHTCSMRVLHMCLCIQVISACTFANTHRYRIRFIAAAPMHKGMGNSCLFWCFFSCGSLVLVIYVKLRGILSINLEFHMLSRWESFATSLDIFGACSKPVTFILVMEWWYKMWPSVCFKVVLFP